jgi:hypothetical protein
LQTRSSLIPVALIIYNRQDYIIHNNTYKTKPQLVGLLKTQLGKIFFYQFWSFSENWNIF